MIIIVAVVDSATAPVGPIESDSCFGGRIVLSDSGSTAAPSTVMRANIKHHLQALPSLGQPNLQQSEYFACVRASVPTQFPMVQHPFS